MSTIVIIAAYGVYAAFWIRFLLHALAWWKSAARPAALPTPLTASPVKAWALTARDVVLFWRLLMVNPALWIGEWVFHVSFLLVMLRHLRYFFSIVPAWAGWFQGPGLFAGYFLPLSLVYILIIRRFSASEKYTAAANRFLLLLMLVISFLGLLMATLFRTDVVTAKLFIQGILTFSPAALPGGILFLLHFSLVLVLVPLLPTHIVTAPLVMLEAERRAVALPLVMHDK